ncbi:MAG TPA: DNA-processing protein DprA, partial [Thermoanaerobaculia bacterium]
VTRGEPAYPERLHHLPLPPPVLAVRGTLPEGPAVAIVGSRRADAYGREVAELFAVQLAAAGVAVVSGFARGIDATAHRGALAAPTGTTVAVLGCGLGVDYPAGHRALGDEIARCGAVVSELPCGATPRAWYFPARNRVIAALAHGTLVVQATLRSGSLITARHANDLGRDVYAVPGRIFDERSLGTNALIRDGAQLVQHPQDVLDALAAPAVAAPPPPRLEPEPPDGLAGDVLARLSRGTEQTAEELARILGCEVDGVLAALLELELAGLLVRRPGSTYTRRI